MRHIIYVLLSTGIITLAYLSVPPSGVAKCTGDQLEKLIDKGFSKQEVRELCSEESTSNGGRPEPEPEPDDSMSTTCRYTMGPKAGRTQYFRPDTPGLTPAYVGGPCHDGMGSVGVAVPDKRR